MRRTEAVGATAFTAISAFILIGLLELIEEPVGCNRPIKKRGGDHERRREKAGVYTA